MKKVIVISLGGSLIIPKEKPDLLFIKKLRKVLSKNLDNYKFVVVCGGGHLARKRMTLLAKEGKNLRQQGLAGIEATKENARTLIHYLKGLTNKSLPKSKEDIKKSLKNNNIIVLGALKYSTNETSDGTAAKIAAHLNAEFINLTNVKGLYTSDPKKSKKAKFIPRISWSKFEKMANKLKYKPGQHFVLDQNASKTIKKHKVKTYLLGKNLKNIDKLLNNKKFTGTTIADENH